MGKPRFHMVSLGCAKNTVDSASMAELLRQAGYSAGESGRACFRSTAAVFCPVALAKALMARKQMS